NRPKMRCRAAPGRLQCKESARPARADGDTSEDRAMMNLFSDEVRRNPFPLFDQLRSTTPVFQLPPPFSFWMILDYDGVKRPLTDPEPFSACVRPTKTGFIFFDPPRHTKLRALIAKAFTPRLVANLEPRICELSRRFLDEHIERGAMDLAEDFAVPLP